MELFVPKFVVDHCVTTFTVHMELLEKNENFERKSNSSSTKHTWSQTGSRSVHCVVVTLSLFVLHEKRGRVTDHDELRGYTHDLVNVCLSAL